MSRNITEDLYTQFLEAKEAAIDFKKFAKLAWPIVEPGTKFVDGWHLDAIAEHLMAVTNGQIKDLLINVPPRHSKSTYVSVMWPVWEWINKPSTKWLYSSYSQGLSTRDSLKSRRLIQSPWFKRHYSDCFSLAKDQKTKMRYDNDRAGYRIATSVTGSNTGEGGDRIVCFTGETLIKLLYGELSIKRICDNNLSVEVASFNKLKQCVEFKRIKQYFINETFEILTIELDSGKKIRCTPNHLIWTGNRQWVKAKDLNNYDSLMTYQKEFSIVSSISIEKQEVPIKIYNIEVEDNNNYFANGYLVHNCDDGNNAAEGESKAVLETTAIWWKEVMSTRKNDPENSSRVVIGQRVSALDISQIFLESATPVHLCLPAEYEGDKKVTVLGWSDPRTNLGELLWPNRFTRPILENLKTELGMYGCNPYEAPILMADLSIKPIGEIKVGDEVVGFSMNELMENDIRKFSRQHLKKSIIKNIFKQIKPLVKMTLSSGEIIRCTADHKWYRRQRNDNPNKSGSYSAAKIGTKLRRICPPKFMKLDKEEERLAGWLAGFFDGDGSISQNNSRPYGSKKSSTIYFYQGAGRNLPLCEKLEYALNYFGFEFKIYEDIRKDPKCINYPYRQYKIKNSSLSVFQKFLHIIQPNKWRDRLIEAALGTNFTQCKETVISIEEDGQDTVYALETTTGNYIVWGLASSNSAGQLQQRPIPRGGGILLEKWFQKYKIERDIYGRIIKPNFDFIIQSWDTAFKEGEENDWSVCLTIGISQIGYYLINRWKGKVAFPELTKKLIEIANIYRPNQIFIEDKASGQSLIQSVKATTRLPIKAIIPEKDKVARCHSISPIIESGKFYVPEDEEWVTDYITEVTTFPAAVHDDQMDATSQALIQVALKKYNIGNSQAHNHNMSR